MKKIILLASILLTSVLSNAQKADVPVVQQTQTNWCWAANSECILTYFGKPANQCDINDYAWSKSNCCSSPGSCNKTNMIVGKNAIEGIVEEFGQLRSTHVDGGVPVDQLKECLGKGEPFVVGCMWNQGGGHVVVGCAYDESAGTMTMMDPWENNGMTTSKYSKSTVKLNGGSGTWKESLIVHKPINVGIDTKTSNNSFNVFPSPSNGVFYVELSAVESSNATVEVINILGEKVYQSSWNNLQAGTKNQIDITNTPKGNYFVSIRRGSKNYNKMIVKN